MKALKGTTAFAWGDLVGQKEVRQRLEKAANEPVHAYLFLGGSGNGLREAAAGFAGLILSAGQTEEAAERSFRLAKAFKHPDIILIEPEGANLRVAEAEEIIRSAVRSPIEGDKKVIVVSGVDAIEPNAIGKLLKIVEEPPASAVFVLMAQEVIPEIVTIASRCVPIAFAPYSITELTGCLVNEGASEEQAKAAASAAGGDLDRARLLVGDDALASRAALWSAIASKLDGRGATVAQLVKDIQATMEIALEALVAVQKQELEDLDERVKISGERGSGRSKMVDRHKREARRLRVDELIFGFAVLARHYRDLLVEQYNEQTIRALESIQTASESLTHNPNESLLLQNLLLQLDAAE